MSTKSKIKKRRPTAEEIAAIMAFYGDIETADLPFPRTARKSHTNGRKITVQTTITFD